MSAREEIRTAADTLRIRPGKWGAREQQAVAELATTRVSPRVRTALIAIFLFTIVVVPVLDGISDIYNGTQKRKAMVAVNADPALFPGRRPRALDFLQFLPSVNAVTSARSVDDVRALVPTPKQLRHYEDELLINSAVGKVVRPWAQWLLSAWLGVGSQNVLIGQDKWLYYADGVQYASGVAFLDSTRLANGSPNIVQNDPRKAVLQLQRELKALGTLLIVVPIPDKAVIKPGPLNPNGRFDQPVQNRSWNQFVQEMRAEGVVLIDPTAAMFAGEQSGSAQFIRANSHWSSAGIDVVARMVADTIDAYAQSYGYARVTDETAYTRRSVSPILVNDLAALLALPGKYADTFGLHARVQRFEVLDRANASWEADTSSSLLVIGDSFVETFTKLEGPDQPSAGFAEQLSYFTQRPVDRRAGHTYDILDVRRALGGNLQEMRAGSAGKRIIIWAFASRKLSMASWPLLQ